MKTVKFSTIQKQLIKSTENIIYTQSSYVAIKTSALVGAADMILMELTINRYTNGVPVKILVQAYDFSTGVLGFRVSASSDVNIEVGHYAENNRRCFFISAKKFQTTHVKAYNSNKGTPIDITLLPLDVKPAAEGEVIV